MIAETHYLFFLVHQSMTGLCMTNDMLWPWLVERVALAVLSDWRFIVGTALPAVWVKSTHQLLCMSLPCKQHKLVLWSSCCVFAAALFNVNTSTSIQNCPLHRGNLNAEMPWDSTNAFLHGGDVSALCQLWNSVKNCVTIAAASTFTIWVKRHVVPILQSTSCCHLLLITCRKLDCQDRCNTSPPTTAT